MSTSELYRTAKTLAFGLMNAGLDLGVLPGHTGYTRFIMLATPRTGSTFLLSALESHSRIRAYGELFKVWTDEEFPRWPPSFGMKTDRLVRDIQQDPAVYLRDHLFRRYPQRVSAVGLKIFYGQAQSPRWRPIWDYLEQERQIRVLHVKRRNLLRKLLSREVARKTGQYRAGPSSDGEQLPAVAIAYEDLCRAFEQMQAEEREFDARFAGHRLTEVIYEQLTADPTSELMRIQEFLGVEYQLTRPSTRRQSTRPLAAAIANYEELKEGFGGTPWASFFDE